MTVEEALRIVRRLSISSAGWQLAGTSRTADEVSEALACVADELEELQLQARSVPPIRPVKDWIPTVEADPGAGPHYALREDVHPGAVLMGPEGLCLCGAPFTAHGAFNACPDGSGTWRTKP